MKPLFFALALFLGMSAAQADTETLNRICINGVCIDNGGIGHDPHRPGHPGYPPPGYPNYPGHGSYESQFIRCESIDYRFSQCYFDSWGVRDVRIWRQHSKSGCAYGRDYGFNRDTIWVANGCRATFQVIR